MRYKILCSDLDGTLLATKSDVSAFAISEIRRIKGRMRIILVSARMPKAMRYIQQDLGITKEPLICYNGAYILHQTRELASVEIGLEHLLKIDELAYTLKIDMGLYHKDEWYVPKNSERVQKEIRYTKSAPVFKNIQATLSDWSRRDIGAHKVMLMGTKDSSDTIFTQLEASLGDHLHLYRSNDTLIEIVPRSVSKRSAIEFLLRSDESLSEVIAFGDNYNDIEMLQAVGCGVAVENAREEVKQVAQRLTARNTEDGVAHFIKTHL
ncbi:HAD family phosphatase [Flavobacteriaceae bacterium TP-CH-4]|uniref:HAD family phosphatase n=1 Tax=Pelagihabitans pacificus TaxID=2696054 RepID=A0A967AWT8_9FLAO|nr:Cof-type HAD-IIB family hydrolase [Pelagihabitans pacificus]NHF61359.1 HAD family phosphatase [Pelagihabitans pacificus]